LPIYHNQTCNVTAECIWNWQKSDKVYSVIPHDLHVDIRNLGFWCINCIATEAWHIQWTSEILWLYKSEDILTQALLNQWFHEYMNILNFIILYRTETLYWKLQSKGFRVSAWRLEILIEFLVFLNYSKQMLESYIEIGHNTPSTLYPRLLSQSSYHLMLYNLWSWKGIIKESKN
jgi:hypothetical protein